MKGKNEAVEGGWDRYYFQPKGTKSNMYAGHYLSAGATPVSLKDGKHKCGDWEFHYKGFNNQNVDGHPSYWHGATTSNLFPKEML
eukprot:15347458-Ditylum_brightwellii.AAC.1